MYLKQLFKKSKTTIWAGYFNIYLEISAQKKQVSLFIYTLTKIKSRSWSPVVTALERHTVPTGQEQHSFLPLSPSNSCSLFSSSWQRSHSVANFPCRFLHAKSKEKADVTGCGEWQLILFYFNFSWAFTRNIFWASLISGAINHFSEKKKKSIPFTWNWTWKWYSKFWSRKKTIAKLYSNIYIINGCLIKMHYAKWRGKFKRLHAV